MAGRQDDGIAGWRAATIRDSDRCCIPIGPGQAAVELASQSRNDRVVDSLRPSDHNDAFARERGDTVSRESVRLRQQDRSTVGSCCRGRRQRVWIVGAAGQVDGVDAGGVRMFCHGVCGLVPVGSGDTEHIQTSGSREPRRSSAGRGVHK